jgi:plastocyanin
MNRSHPQRPGAFLVAALAILLAAFSLLGPVSPTAARQANEVTVSVVDFAFDPAALSVPAGTTVTWTNDGERPHTVTAEDGSFDSGRLDPGESFSFTFDQPGTVSYYCGFHPEMQGTIEVTAAEDDAIGDDAIEVATADETHDEAAHQPEASPEAVATGEGGGDSRNLPPVEPSRLAHIHAGTCEELGIVVYSLPDLQTYRLDENNGSGIGAVELISGTANVPISDLFGEPFSIHIHESAQNKQSYIACSDVGGRPGESWDESQGLMLEAIEQNDSGYNGFTQLKPSADGGTAVTVSLAATPDSVEAVESQEAVAPSTTYTSPSFGYTIGYGEAWEESENASTSGHDRFVLFNGKSYITFTGANDFDGDPATCVDAFVDQLTADPNVSNLELAVDENGVPLQRSTEATGATVIYNHDYAFPGRVEPYTLFVGCVPLVENEAVLAIVQNVPTSDYNTEVELREALLRGLTLAQ